jgi:RNA-directed DNA polymerase
VTSEACSSRQPPAICHHVLQMMVPRANATPMTKKTIQILFDAMHHGKYEFADFLNGDVAANYDSILNKKGKRIYRPNKKLKAYHAFLNTFLCEYLDLNGRVVYSYRKGINPHQAIGAHAQSRAFFQTDIVNFFGSIDRDIVRSTIISRGVRIPIADLHAHLERILDLMTVDASLPVGFSTSPLISNACLTGFDDELEAHCRRAGLTYTRYADDIVISAQSREILKDANSTVSDLLVRHFGGKLRLNTSKSKLTTVGRKVKILGMVITPSGQVTVDMELKKRIEVLLHFYTRNRETFLAVVQYDMKAGVEQLGGYVNYINAADKPYLEKLRKKYGSTVIDSFLHRSAT